MSDESPSPASFVVLVIMVLMLAVAGIGGCAYGLPQYHVYEQRLEGEAMLAHAQASKEIAVAEAKAKMESASLLADAEVARAKGVAAANQIIGQSLKDNESYLRYLWITEVAGRQGNTTVYIPTEANMPLLEAGRLNKPDQ
jgi:5-deoxy-D-glucuronate isomerase